MNPDASYGDFDEESFRYARRHRLGGLIYNYDPPTIGSGFTNSAYGTTYYMWDTPAGMPAYDTSDFVNGIPPWRQSLGADGTDVGSPVYKKYKYGAEAAVMAVNLGTLFRPPPAEPG
jgi:hypothetical protein